VVTLLCGLVAGDTVLGHVPETMESTVAPVTGREAYSGLPRILQRLLGSVPLVHVDDVCTALVFCMEQPSLSGRFLCAAAYPTVHDILHHYGSKYPHLDDLLRE
jgi:nucleoside-diphosphate-sugar epimerase